MKEKHSGERIIKQCKYFNIFTLIQSMLRTVITLVDVFGVIKSIVGNEVIVTQVDMDAIREQMTANMPEGTQRPEGDIANNNFVPGTTGQRMAGEMRGPSGGGAPFEGNDEMRTQMEELMRKNSLGDVKILIPVGIPMYTRGSEASLADVVVGDNISVWLDTLILDRKIAEYVTLQ